MQNIVKQVTVNTRNVQTFLVKLSQVQENKPMNPQTHDNTVLLCCGSQLCGFKQNPDFTMGKIAWFKLQPLYQHHFLALVIIKHTKISTQAAGCYCNSIYTKIQIPSHNHTNVITHTIAKGSFRG